MIRERTGEGKNLEGATDQQLREICNAYHKWAHFFITIFIYLKLLSEKDIPPKKLLSLESPSELSSYVAIRRIVALESEKFDLERDVQVRLKIKLSFIFKFNLNQGIESFSLFYHFFFAQVKDVNINELNIAVNDLKGK